MSCMTLCDGELVSTTHVSIPRLGRETPSPFGRRKCAWNPSARRERREGSLSRSTLPEVSPCVSPATRTLGRLAVRAQWTLARDESAESPASTQRIRPAELPLADVTTRNPTRPEARPTRTAGSLSRALRKPNPTPWVGCSRAELRGPGQW